MDLSDGQSLFLVHMHGEGASVTYELIEVVYDANNKTITFTTSSFSPFMLNKGIKTVTETTTTETATQEAPAASGETPATTAQATPAAAQTVQAAAQAARTGEAQSYNAVIGVILSAAAMVFYVWRRDIKIEWYD